MVDEKEIVIRCGECRYAHLTSDNKLIKYCDNWCDENRIATELYLPVDFYCAYAKPKKQNNRLEGECQ